MGECVKKLSAFQTMSKDGQFLDGTLFDICVTVVSSHISEHDIQKSDVANFQSGQNVSKMCEGTYAAPFCFFYPSLHGVGLDVCAFASRNINVT